MDVWDIREDDFASVSSAVAAADAGGGGAADMCSHAWALPAFLSLEQVGT